jgi:hypothetical protein
VNLISRHGVADIASEESSADERGLDEDKLPCHSPVAVSHSPEMSPSPMWSGRSMSSRLPIVLDVGVVLAKMLKEGNMLIELQQIDAPSEHLGSLLFPILFGTLLILRLPVFCMKGA